MLLTLVLSPSLGLLALKEIAVIASPSNSRYLVQASYRYLRGFSTRPADSETKQVRMAGLGHTRATN